VRSLETMLRRAWIAELMLTMSILSACSDNATAPRPVVTPVISTADVAFCSGSQPNWVAFQDGDGAWTQAQPMVVGPYIAFRYAFTTNRAAVATVRAFAHGLTALSIQYGVPGEMAIVGDTNPAHCGPVVARTLLGTVAGLDTNEIATISAGFGARELTFPAEGNSFALRGLINGPQDILATRSTRLNGIETLTRVILRRNPELPDSATIPVLDFDSPESFAPVVANVTINGLGVEGASSHTQLRTDHSESLLTFLTNSPVAATRTYFAIPEARLQAGDLQILSATANSSTANTILSAAVYFRSPVDQTLTLGAPVVEPILTTVAATPVLRLRARFAPQDEYDRLTLISFQQGPNTVVTVGMTAAYAGLNSTGYDLILPDLSSAAGFDSRWALQPAEPVFWVVNRIGGTLGLGLSAVQTDGATVRTGIAFGNFAP